MHTAPSTRRRPRFLGGHTQASAPPTANKAEPSTLRTRAYPASSGEGPALYQNFIRPMGGVVHTHIDILVEDTKTFLPPLSHLRSKLQHNSFL